MLKTWPVYLKHFVDDRTEELAEKLLFHERKYIQLKKRAFQAVEQLKAGIGSEASELYNITNMIAPKAIYMRINVIFFTKMVLLTGFG
jgi:hypothetical protein